MDGVQAGVDTAESGSCLSEIMVWGGDEVTPKRQGLRRARKGWMVQWGGWTAGSSALDQRQLGELSREV